MNSFRFLLFIIVFAAKLSSTVADVPQTISSLPDYTSLRICAQGCFWYTVSSTQLHDGVAEDISCESVTVNVGAYQSCYCNTVAQTEATRYLSTCISQACLGDTGSFTSDVHAGVKLYQEYCTQRGFVESGSASTVAAITTADKSSTSESSSANQSPGGSSQSTFASQTTTLETKSQNLGSGSQSTFVSQTATAATVQTVSAGSNSNPSNNSNDSGGIGLGNILTIIFGSVAVLIAIAIGVWQGRSGSVTRKTINNWNKGRGEP